MDLLDISFGASGYSSPQQSHPAPSNNHHNNSDPWGMPSSQQPPRNDMWSSKPDPWLPPPGVSAYPMSKESTGAIARTRSPNVAAADGWLNNSAIPPTSNAVPVLPAKPSNDLNDAWSVKNPDPWNNKHPQPIQSKVPDPWNGKTMNETAPLDPWAPLSGLGDSGVNVSSHFLNC